MSERLSQGPPSPPASPEQLRDPTTDALGAPYQRKEMRLARAQR
jgi:hypothetical protein